MTGQKKPCRCRLLYTFDFSSFVINPFSLACKALGSLLPLRGCALAGGRMQRVRRVKSGPIHKDRAAVDLRTDIRRPLQNRGNSLGGHDARLVARGLTTGRYPQIAVCPGEYRRNAERPQPGRLYRLGDD